MVINDVQLITTDEVFFFFKKIVSFMSRYFNFKNTTQCTGHH